MICGSSVASRLAAGKPGIDPISIAYAAKAHCGEARANLIHAIQKAHNHQIWSEMIAVYDRKFTEISIAAAID